MPFAQRADPSSSVVQRCDEAQHPPPTVHAICPVVQPAGTSPTTLVGEGVLVPRHLRPLAQSWPKEQQPPPMLEGHRNMEVWVQGRGQHAATVETVRVGEVMVVVSLHWTWSWSHALPHTEPIAQHAALSPEVGSTIQL